MSDPLTLAEARERLADHVRRIHHYGFPCDPRMESRREADVDEALGAFDEGIAAHLRDLCGQPESETMEQAMNAFREAATVEMQLGKRLDRQEEAGLHAAYPLLVAPLRAEVERLKAERDDLEAANGQCEAERDATMLSLATAEARVRELEYTVEAQRDTYEHEAINLRDTIGYLKRENLKLHQSLAQFTGDA